MKTKILPIIVGLGIGAVISPVLGMAISPTRNLIMSMAPQEAVLTLANKIKQKETGEQQKLSSEEKVQEIIQESQPEESIVEPRQEIIPTVQSETSREQIEACQNTKTECEKKMKNIKKEIDDLENQVEEQEKLYDEEKQSTHAVKETLKYRETMVEKAEKDLKSKKSELQNITNGECKNYNKSC